MSTQSSTVGGGGNKAAANLFFKVEGLGGKRKVRVPANPSFAQLAQAIGEKLTKDQAIGEYKAFQVFDESDVLIEDDDDYPPHSWDNLLVRLIGAPVISDNSAAGPFGCPTNWSPPSIAATQLAQGGFVTGSVVNRTAQLKKCMGILQQIRTLALRANPIATAAGSGWGKSAFGDSLMATLEASPDFYPIALTWNHRCPTAAWEHAPAKKAIDKTIAVRLAHVLFAPDENFVDFELSYSGFPTSAAIMKHVNAKIDKRTTKVLFLDEAVKTGYGALVVNYARRLAASFGTEWVVVATALAPTHLGVNGGMKRCAEGGDTSISDYYWIVLPNNPDDVDELVKSLPWLPEQSDEIRAITAPLAKYLLSMAGGNWRARAAVYKMMEQPPQGNGPRHLLFKAAADAQNQVRVNTRQYFELKTMCGSKRNEKTAAAIGEFLLMAVLRRKVALVTILESRDMKSDADESVANGGSHNNCTGSGSSVGHSSLGNGGSFGNAGAGAGAGDYVQGHTPGYWLVEGVLSNTMDPAKPLTEVPKIALTLLSKWAEDDPVAGVAAGRAPFRACVPILKSLLSATRTFSGLAPTALDSQVEFRFELLAARWLQLVLTCASMTGCEELQVIAAESSSGDEDEYGDGDEDETKSHVLLPGFIVYGGKAAETACSPLRFQPGNDWHCKAFVLSGQILTSNGKQPNELACLIDPPTSIYWHPILAHAGESCWDEILATPEQLILKQIKHKEGPIDKATFNKMMQRLLLYRNVLWTFGSDPKQSPQAIKLDLPPYTEAQVMLVVFAPGGISAPRGGGLYQVPDDFEGVVVGPGGPGKNWLVEPFGKTLEDLLHCMNHQKPKHKPSLTPQGSLSNGGGSKRKAPAPLQEVTKVPKGVAGSGSRSEEEERGEDGGSNASTGD